MSTAPCYCGAPDCPSCGPAQGYTVVFVPGRGYINPEEGEEYMSRDDWLADKADHDNDEGDPL